MRSVLYCLVPLIALSGCGGGSAREALGFDRKSPDEFKVVARPPLSVPPEFNLRPPASGENPFGTSTAQEDTKALVLGKEHKTLPANDPLAVQSSSLESKGEAAFLGRMGAEQTDPSIRERLEKETAPLDEEDRSLFERLKASGEGGDPVVKAGDEAKRLKKNQEEGASPTEGDTPSVKPKDRGWLGKVF